MKSLTCDVCGAVETGSSEKEVIDKMMLHMQDIHKDMADKYKAMPKVEQDKMDGDMRKLIKDIK